MELIILFVVLLVVLVLLPTKFKPESRPKPKPTQPKPSNRFEKLKAFTAEPHKPTYTEPIRYANQFCSREEKQQHLASEYWRNLKQQRLDIANHKCEACGHEYMLHLHHITYTNLLVETTEDVVILCNLCHQAIHTDLGYDRTTEYPISTIVNLKTKSPISHNTYLST